MVSYLRVGTVALPMGLAGVGGGGGRGGVGGSVDRSAMLERPRGSSEILPGGRGRRIRHRTGEAGGSPELRKTTACEALEALGRLCWRPGKLGERSGVCGALVWALEAEELATSVGGRW